ncbi:hypothetical protein T15_0315 [Streptococcus suis T15]|nr:hypothetical protein T15_0315 [Streptococcus suis T15]
MLFEVGYECHSFLFPYLELLSFNQVNYNNYKKKVKLFITILNKIILIIQRKIKKATESRFDIRLLALTIRTNAVDG